MNARVLLLMLVTGLFMAAWNGDQAAMQTALAAREQQRASKTASLKTPVQPISRTVQMNQQPAVTPEPTAIPESEVPLPAGIASGTYQAVHQSGRTFRINVPAADNSNPARELYTIDAQNGERWYLIRLAQ